jgi:hypothetical protein
MARHNRNTRPIAGLAAVFAIGLIAVAVPVKSANAEHHATAAPGYFYSDLGYYSSPAPTYYSTPAPTYYATPAPTYYYAPAPTYYSQPAPTYYSTPAPTYYSQPAPTYYSQPAYYSAPQPYAQSYNGDSSDGLWFSER